MIELGEQNETEVVESVLKFQSQNGLNCLIGLFQMATEYRIENNSEYPSGPMLSDIEGTCLFLVQKAKDFKLDLDKILNHTTEYGRTLFSQASIYSETITKHLLTGKYVRVNSIDLGFVTPYFRVRLKNNF